MPPVSLGVCKRGLVLLLALGLLAPPLVSSLVPFALAQTSNKPRLTAAAKNGQGSLQLVWRQRTEYKLTVSGTLVLIAFSRAFANDTRAVAGTFSTFAKEVRKTGGNRVILIRLKEKMTVRGSRSKDGRTMDFSFRSSKAPKNDGDTKPDKVTLGLTEGRGFVRLVFKWPQAVSYRLAAEDRKATIFFTRPGTLEATSVQQALAKKGIRIDFQRAGARTIAKLGFDRPVRLRANGQGDVFTLDVFDKDKTPDTGPGKDPLRADVSVTKDANATKITINWPARVSAASFRYGGYIWVVFGAVAQVDLRDVRKNLGPGVEDVEVTTLDNATLMRFRAGRQIRAGLTAEGWQWVVTLSQKKVEPRINMFIYAEPDAPNGGRVVVRTGDAATVLIVEDPVVGVPLIIVPVTAPGMGVRFGRKYVKFDILPSVQGVAIVPKADGITANSVDSGIAVRGPASGPGLFLGGRGKK